MSVEVFFKADVGADLVGKVEAGIRRTTQEIQELLQTMLETMLEMLQVWGQIFLSHL